MKNSLVLFQGSDFRRQTGSNRFVKDVLRVGRWKHPVTGQEVEITQARINNLVRNCEEYRQTLDRKAIPYQDGHNFDAKRTLGWWTQFFSHGDRLYGIVEATDEEAAKKMEAGSIRSVSARIDANVADTKGKVYDEVFTHVCATPLPVLDGQQDFIKLSRETETLDLLIPSEFTGFAPEKGNRMDPKKLAILLGLPETATPEQIEEAAKKVVGDQKLTLDQVKAEQGKVTALSADLKAHGLEIKDGKVVKLAAPPPADETPREKAQRLRIEELEKGAQLSHAQSAAAQAEQAVKDGKVPPALKVTLSRLLAIQGKQKAILLSKEGSVEEMVDVVNETLALVKGLPSITGHKLSQEQGDEEKKKAADLDKEIDAVVARIQPQATKA